MNRPHAEDGVDRRWSELERQAEQRQRLRWSLQHHVAIRCGQCGVLFPVPEDGRQALTLCPWCRPAPSMTAPTADADGPNAIATNDPRRSGGRTVGPTGAG
jgi:hypothetical protein